jgi:tetratricopeptide (TPR) repeat protein
MAWLAALAVLLLADPSARELEAQAQRLRAKGDAAGALAAYEKASALEPKSARIQDEIGFLLAVMQRPEEAAEHFQRASALDPGFAPAHYHLGVSFWLRQDPAQAIPELRRAAQLAPGSFEFRFFLGDALNATGAYREALP